jgi:N-acetylgalactosamine-N,N'-diacetylbacillosaminyl-diphospho-undecaprenol 4-alpha-N-acetylgalactosaminyltransferase
LKARRDKVHHVIVIDKVQYDFAGELLNLGKLKNKTNGVFNKVKDSGY